MHQLEPSEVSPLVLLLRKRRARLNISRPAFRIAYLVSTRRDVGRPHLNRLRKHPVIVKEPRVANPAFGIATPIRRLWSKGLLGLSNPHSILNMTPVFVCTVLLKRCPLRRGVNTGLVVPTETFDDTFTVRKVRDLVVFRLLGS